MNQVSGEQEMRYLLLEKDIEDRDALELITRLEIISFLRSQFAENVVKEIWRSPYAAGDSIFTASSNFYMLFQYYHCIVDEEQSRRLMQGKDVRKIQNHSMQFTVWRYSGKSRMIIEFFTTMLITTLVHIYLRSAIEQSEAIYASINELVTLENNYSSIDSEDLVAQEAAYN